MRMAIPRPMPRPAPVMTATLSVRVFMRTSGDCSPPRLSPRGVALEGAVLASFFFPPPPPLGENGGDPQNPRPPAPTLRWRGGAERRGMPNNQQKPPRLYRHGALGLAPGV